MFDWVTDYEPMKFKLLLVLISQELIGPLTLTLHYIPLSASRVFMKESMISP